MTPRRFPDSEIPGSMPVSGSPRLIAAVHVLHRLPIPRHPPSALSSLIASFRRTQRSGPHRIQTTHAKEFAAISRFGFQRAFYPAQPTGTGCGADRIRTDDPRLAKPVLSQLSYSPERAALPGPAPVVGLGRFELPTSRLSGVRSNQLSYRPS